MKNCIVLCLCLTFIGCAHSTPKRAPEVVASCFSDNEDQSQFCKTKRVDEESRVVTTRCIGSENKIAIASLRGKCVEKLCAENSNTECTVRGEYAVLQQYAELVRDRLFAEDHDDTPQKTEKSKRGRRVKRIASQKSSAAEVDIDPDVQLPPEPTKEEPTNQAPQVKTTPAQKVPVEPPEMKVTLRPDKGTASVSAIKSRSPASAPPSDGFKRVCVSKKDLSAPEILRGKCAIRNCKKGRCSYKGRKEMFDWVAR